MAELIGTDATVGIQSAAGRGGDPGRAGLVNCAELIRAGVRSELLVFLALRRAAGGGIAKFCDRYCEWGYPTASWLAGAFEQLTRTGLLVLAEQGPEGLQRMSLSPAGQLRYQRLSALLSSGGATPRPGLRPHPGA